MRIGKGRRRGGGRIRVWFDACVAVLSFILFVVVVSALVYCVVKMLNKPSAHPITMSANN
jgi:hypothetical protein